MVVFFCGEPCSLVYIFFFFEGQIKRLNTTKDVISIFNPLSPHKASKHHYKYLETDFIITTVGVLE